MCVHHVFKTLKDKGKRWMCAYCIHASCWTNMASLWRWPTARINTGGSEFLGKGERKGRFLKACLEELLWENGRYMWRITWLYLMSSCLMLTLFLSPGERNIGSLIHITRQGRREIHILSKYGNKREMEIGNRNRARMAKASSFIFHHLYILFVLQYCILLYDQWCKLRLLFEIFVGHAKMNAPKLH